MGVRRRFQLQSTLLAILVMSSAFARTPLDGGRLLEKDDPLFPHVYTLKTQLFEGFKNCTSTRVADQWFSTSAHCVNNIPPTLSPGEFIVEAVFPHPKYAKTKRQDEIDNTSFAVRYDIALLKVRKNETAHRSDYIPLVSAKTKFPATRGNFRFVGTGAHQLFWSGASWEPVLGADQNPRSGSGHWLSCTPTAPEFTALALANQVQAIVGSFISAPVTRPIRIDQDGRPIFTPVDDAISAALPGDSGSAVIEKDADGNLVITGIQSEMIVNFKSPRLVILNQRTGKEETVLVQEKWIDDWAARQSNSTFPEIQDLLKKRGLLDPSGELLPGYEVSREYSRSILNRVTELSTADIQDFIAQTMRETDPKPDGSNASRPDGIFQANSDKPPQTKSAD